MSSYYSQTTTTTTQQQDKQQKELSMTDSSMSRSAKHQQALGMIKVQDPSSGQTLYCRHEQKYVKSPVTGATLKISNSTYLI